MIKLVFVTVSVLIVTVSARSIETDDQYIDIWSDNPCQASTYFEITGAKCVCDYQGQSICETVEEKFKRINCTPGETFNDGCNTCECMENGEVTYCTSMFCFHQPRYCKRGNTYQIGAKACKCNVQGDLICA
jgi:hypothetical protein